DLLSNHTHLHLIVADARDDLRTRRQTTVTGRKSHLDEPVVAVTRPRPLSERAVRVEDPGAELMRPRIPANHLIALTRRIVRALDGERTNQIGTVVRPPTVGF